MLSSLLTTAAQVPAVVLVLACLTRWVRPLVLLAGLLAALRSTHGPVRARMFTHFASSLPRRTASRRGPGRGSGRGAP
ncbi:hypothetical protein ACF09G_36180 [Streptomyces albogriseolus]|uniref:hypothetical protein n=1 Tax=Streptomyces albogriseolus TaxID=1887 RepID=UPI001982EFF9|nr:hypothetical protein [Streptomyces sp.]